MERMEKKVGGNEKEEEKEEEKVKGAGVRTKMRVTYGRDYGAACSGYDGTLELAPPSPAGDDVSCDEFGWEEEEEMTGIERMASSIKV